MESSLILAVTAPEIVLVSLKRVAADKLGHSKTYKKPKTNSKSPDQIMCTQFQQGFPLVGTDQMVTQKIWFFALPL